MTTYTEQAEPAGARLTQHQKYTRWVESTCRNDPGARVTLRKGLRRELDEAAYTRGMHRLIAGWLPKGPDTPDSEQRAYYTVAALIASQPRYSFAESEQPAEPEEPVSPSASDAEQAQNGEAPSPPAGKHTVSAARRRTHGSSLGAALAQAVTGGPGREREMRKSTGEARLNLLTRQSANGLHRHLPATVRYLRDLDVPVDWSQLLADLIDWPARSGRISRRWLQDFYWLSARADQDKASDADLRESLEPGPQD